MPLYLKIVSSNVSLFCIITTLTVTLENFRSFIIFHRFAVIIIGNTFTRRWLPAALIIPNTHTPTHIYEYDRDYSHVNKPLTRIRTPPLISLVDHTNGTPKASVIIATVYEIIGCWTHPLFINILWWNTDSSHTYTYTYICEQHPNLVSIP